MTVSALVDAESCAKVLSSSSLNAEEEETVNNEGISSLSSVVRKIPEQTEQDMFFMVELTSAPGVPEHLKALTDSVAIKVVTRPTGVSVAMLEREHRILRNDLAGSPVAIGAVGPITSYQDKPAIYLEQFNGVAMEEWYDDTAAQTNMSEFYQVAEKIVLAVSELHSRGVVHNGLNVQNILYSDHEQVVKITGFGSAECYDYDDRGTNYPSSTREIGKGDPTNDLISLGYVFYNILTRHQLQDTRNDETEIRRALLNCDIHPAFAFLVLSLIQCRNPRNVSPYTTAAKVAKDIRFFLDNPDVFLTCRGTRASLDRLDFSVLESKLWGRYREIRALLDAYKERKQVILVPGASGVGKTALVLNALKDQVDKDGGFFLAGKFDQQQSAEPYSAIISALADFPDYIAANHERLMERVAQQFLQGAGADSGMLLTNLVPCLSQIVGEQSFHVEQRVPLGKDNQNQLIFVIRLWMKAIASLGRPVVLFLDDLQWADESSLEIFEAVATDTDESSLIIVGTYRDNELTSHCKLSKRLGKMERACVDMCRIYVSTLCDKSINNMISAVLRLPPQMTQPLASLVSTKSAGNIFFVKQFMDSLWAEGLLNYSKQEQRWIWDDDKIQLKHADNVVELVSEKVRKLPEEVQEALSAAACLGAEVHLMLLEAMLPSAAELLDEAEKIGLVEFMSANESYRFIHDGMQHAAYHIVPRKERSLFHLRIGRSLWSKLTKEQLEENMFLVLSQLNRGATRIKKKQERVSLAHLNLQAGKRAMKSSAFASAAVYFSNGIDLLGENCWREEYELSLELFNSAAEAEFCNGRFDEMDQRIQSVFDHAQSFEDSLRSKMVEISGLGSRNQLSSALKTGFAVLRKLGQHFPSKPRMLYILKEYLKTKRMLRGKTDAYLMDLPLMTDPAKLAAMQILNLVFLYSYRSRPDLCPLVTFRMVQLSLKDGISMLASNSFAAYGLVACGALEKMEEGYRFGQLGISLVKKFNRKEWVPRLYCGVYGAINVWTKPLRTTLEPLRCTHRLALEMGDIEYAMVAAGLCCYNSFFCGVPLPQIEQELSMYRKRMSAYNVDFALKFTANFYQLVRCLLGKSIDTEVSGVEDSAVWVYSDDKRKLPHYNSSIKEYLDGEYEKAINECLRQRRENAFQALGTFDVCFTQFIECLSVIAFARKTKSRKYNYIRRRNMRHLKKCRPKARENLHHMVALVKAEKASLAGRRERANELYDDAIRSAHQEGFLHVEAIACERAADHWRGSNTDPDAKAVLFYDRAISAYTKWGAVVKAGQLRRRRLSLVSCRQR